MAERRTRWTVGLLATLAIFFATWLLLPHWWPTLGRNLVLIWLTFAGALIICVLLLAGLVGLILRLLSRAVQAATALLSVGAGGLLLFGVALLFSHLLGRGLPTGSFVRPFDRGAWNGVHATLTGNDISDRQKMLGDVVRHILPGKSRAQIEALLGPSEQTEYFCETGRDLIYMTGEERDSIFAIDNEWLLIWLDGSGRYVRSEVVTD
jgi:hypothetical protein